MLLQGQGPVEGEGLTRTLVNKQYDSIDEWGQAVQLIINKTQWELEGFCLAFS